MTEWEIKHYRDAKLAYAALMKFYPFTLDDLDGEQWKWIPNYEGLYQVSTFGRTKRFYKSGKARILKPALGRRGYLSVDICKNNCHRTVTVHKIVALTFIPNDKNKRTINHIDGHPLNCCVENLEWATPSENSSHAVHIGLIRSGEDNPITKLTNKQVIYIRENPDSLNGRTLAKKFGVSPTTIYQIQTGQTYKLVNGAVRGARPQKPRLTDKIRAQIKTEYVKGSKELGCYGLAEKYNVCPQTIWRIVNEK